MSTTAAGTYVIDPVHSTADFSVKHMVVSTFRGTFGAIDGSLDLSGDEPQITGRVPVSSLEVKDENLNGHLLSPEFFDAERHAEISFVSTAVRRGEGDTVEVDGDLTVKGITKPVTATGTIVGPAAGIDGGDRIGVSLTTTVDRTAFDLLWNAPLPKGGFALGNDVTLTVNLEFAAQA